jgi:hypothetical protein
MTLILINDNLVVEKSWYGSWIYYYYAISAHHQQRLEFSFPVQKHSQNYYASKSLQVYAKWINMNWKLIHMISTNTTILCDKVYQ